MFLDMTGPELAAALGVERQGFTRMGPRPHIAPGSQALVLTPGGLRPMRWGIMQSGLHHVRGDTVTRTVVNAPAARIFQTLAAPEVTRAVVPVTGWYEWSGIKPDGDIWRVSVKEKELMFLAAISLTWRGPGGLKAPQFAIVSCAANEELSHINSRMGVMLRAEDLDRWMEGSGAQVAQLLALPPPEPLFAAAARGVDWTAA